MPEAGRFEAEATDAAKKFELKYGTKCSVIGISNAKEFVLKSEGLM